MIWEQKVSFWNIPSNANISWYNKINPLLLIALCLLLTPVAHCSLFKILCCWLLNAWNGVCRLYVNTNVPVTLGCFSVPFVGSIDVQCVKMSPIEHVTCGYWILLSHNKHQCFISNQFLLHMVNKWKSVTTPLDCNVQVFWKNKSIPFDPLCE